MLSIAHIGRYEIVGPLGSGGMAVVYRAHDPYFGREVAIKILPRRFLESEQHKRRFHREARTIANLEHPAIVPVHDFGEYEGQPYLVMRLMKGESLAHTLRQPVPPIEIVRLLQPLANALDYAHGRGVIHRDLKPANILFDQDGRPYLSDFGLVKLAASESTELSLDGVIVGTPAYMSPEQARAKGNLDYRTDIYSLGVILFQLLTGRLPYQADDAMGMAMAHIVEPVPNLSLVRPNLPADYGDIITKSMAKEPAERYSKASELVQGLHAALLADPLTSADFIVNTLALDPVTTGVKTRPGKIETSETTNIEFQTEPTAINTSSPREVVAGAFVSETTLLDATQRRVPTSVLTLFGIFVIGSILFVASVFRPILLLTAESTASPTSESPPTTNETRDLSNKDASDPPQTVTTTLISTVATRTSMTMTPTSALVGGATSTSVSSLTPTMTSTATATSSPTVTRPSATSTYTPTPSSTITPVPDSDGDGVADNVDDCPNQGGPDWNKGCPNSTNTPTPVLALPTNTPTPMPPTVTPTPMPPTVTPTPTPVPPTDTPTPTPGQPQYPTGDINKDCVVDNADYDLLQAAFGSTPGGPGWNPSADLNGDGAINIQDYVILSQNFGATCP